MELILEDPTFFLIDAFAAMPSACGVATLQNETWDKAMEYGVLVVAIEAVLNEVARCEGGLFGEEFEGEVAGSCGEENFGCWLGLEVVESRHVSESRVERRGYALQ